jgi:hypothetical protein
MDRLRRLIVVVTPAVAAATVALGLRVGASGPRRVASLYAAPPGKDADHVAWQVVTHVDHYGVKEAQPMQDLRVVARAGDREATWTGASNGDGVAEARLDLVPREGQSVSVEIFEGASPAPIGRGTFTFHPPAWGPAEGASTWVRPTKREGALRLDVALQGERLAVGFPGSAWIRVQDATTGAALAGVTVTIEPEPGLEVASAPKPTCANGFTEARLTPMGHVIGAAFKAKSERGATGEWFGGLSVAGGADTVDLPLAIAPGKPTPLQLVTPGVRDLAYVEVDDERGRVFATVLSLPKGGSFSGASFTLPPLLPGLYWLVTSGEPRGAESLAGAAVARPFTVSEGAPDPCALAPTVAVRAGGGFRRWLAVEGVDVGPERSRRKLGLAIALGSLLVAAILEGLLLFQGARRARRTIAAAFADDEAAAERVAKRPVAGSVAVGILVALLGFGLLAALLVWRG